MKFNKKIQIHIQKFYFKKRIELIKLDANRNRRKKKEEEEKKKESKNNQRYFECLFSSA